MKNPLHLLPGTLAFLFSACSPERKLANRLQDTWSIAGYEERTGGRPGSGPVMTDAGTLTFGSGGTGTKNIRYSIMESGHLDSATFAWQNTAKTVTITGTDGAVAKSWIVLANKKKSQEWRSTDGKGNVIILRLAR